MLVAEACEVPKSGCDAVLRRIDRERGAGADRRAADALLRLPLLDLRREHVLPRGLVPATPDHPDLVAVVHDGRAAEEEEKRIT